MNAVDMAKKAYGANATPVRTPRSTEYALFARVTQRMRTASQMPRDMAELARALHDNRRLWTTLAVDVVDKENALPESLRSRIFYLNEFVGHHSRKVLKGEAQAEPLIEINTAVMRGLGQEAEKL